MTGPPPPPQVVVAVHQPLLAEALARVLQRGLLVPSPRTPPGTSVEVITLDRQPDPEAVHVLRLPESIGDPATLDSSGHRSRLVLTSLQDVADLVDRLLATP